MVPYNECVMVYDLENDFISFSQWISYQMGIQMISTKIAEKAIFKHRREVHVGHKNCDTHVT